MKMKRFALMLSCIASVACGDDENQCGKCADLTYMCDEVHSADQSNLTFDQTPEQILATAEGTWLGEYPGGDTVERTSLTVTVKATAGEPVFGSITWIVADAGSRSEQDAEDAHAYCSYILVPAQVTISMPEASLQLTSRQLVSWSAKKPYPNPSANVTPGGPYTTAKATVGGKEVSVGIVFGSDGKLWVSITPDAYDFKLSAMRS